MLGPPAFAGSACRDTARIESRTSSAVSRRMSNRQNRSFAGSIAQRLGVAPATTCGRRSTVMISRCMRLSCQPPADELAGQPVEQLGVRRRRRRACRSRSATRTMPAAEVVLPEAVDHHPGRQRVVRRRDPVRPAPSAGRSLRRPSPARESSASATPSTAGKPGSTFAPGDVRVAADQHVRLRRLHQAVVDRQRQLLRTGPASVSSAVAAPCSRAVLASCFGSSRNSRHLLRRPAAGRRPRRARWSSAGIFLIASSSIAVICRVSSAILRLALASARPRTSPASPAA